jgi:hypothetical protein
MRLRLLFCAIVVLLTASLSARADVVTFNVFGTFVDHTTVTGNLVIDTTLEFWSPEISPTLDRTTTYSMTRNHTHRRMRTSSFCRRAAGCFRI